MKKEQIIDIIGEAPDHYVKDAKEYKKKRRIPDGQSGWAALRQCWQSHCL